MKIIARLDADSNIGAGHLMRVLTLLNQLIKQSDYCPSDITIVSYSLSDTFKKLIADHGFHHHRMNQVDDWSLDFDAQATAALIDKHAIADLIIVDHYQLDKNWEVQLTPYCHQLVVIDDLADRAHHCTTLIDQTLGRKKDDYSHLVPTYCKRLLGTRYTMLRPEFQHARQVAKKAQNHEIKNILITFGATDPQGDSLKVITWLAQFLNTNPQIHVHCKVMITSASPHLDSIKQKCDIYPWLSCTIDEKNVAELLLNTDLAIGASGSASWERCCLGIPTIAFQTADNQKMVLTELHKAGAIANLKQFSAHSQTEFEQGLSRLFNDIEYYLTMRRNSFNVCDGSGAGLICDHLLSNTLSLRLATKEDENLLYQWQSNPEIRQYSRNPHPVTLSEHRAWFSHSLTLKHRSLYIVELNAGKKAIAVGMLRLDEISSQQYEISILIDPQFQKQNLAWRTLKLTPNSFYNKRIMASVHKENDASQALFKRAGFTKIADDLFQLDALNRN